MFLFFLLRNHKEHWQETSDDQLIMELFKALKQPVSTQAQSVLIKMNSMSQSWVTMTLKCVHSLLCGAEMSVWVCVGGVGGGCVLD